MKNINLFLIICILVLSCVSPQKSFNKNDFSRAFKSSLKKLKKNDTNEEYLKILKLSLSKILAKEELNVLELVNSKNLKDKSKAISKYSKMKEKILVSSKYTNNEFNKKDSLYSKEIQSLKDELGNEYFNMGLNDLNMYDQSKLKSNAKSAYTYFIKAKYYEFNNFQLDSLISYSLEEAKLIYIIEPDEPFGISSFSIDNILEDLESESDEFISVEYDPISVFNNADCIIEIEIKSLDIDLDEDISSKEFEEEIKLDSTKITVKAELEIKKITKTSELVVVISPSGNQNCTLSSSRISETFIEEIIEYNYSGDERAVPRRYKNKEDNEFKDEDEILLELLKELYPEIKRDIF